jgi:hypothetical protein
MTNRIIVVHARTVANEIADPRIPGAAVRARVIAVIAAAHHAHVHGIVVIGEAAASGNEAVVDGVGVAVAVAIDDGMDVTSCLSICMFVSLNECMYVSLCVKGL